MENNNSTQTEPVAEGQSSTPGKKGIFGGHGRKKIIIICIAAFLLFSFIARGFGSRGAPGLSNRGRGNRESVLAGTGNTINAANGFEPIEIIFAESIAARRDGYGLTHNALMREASRMGADAIINVNIFPTSVIINRSWSGSALAVRYVDNAESVKQ
jgi:hypothetical protein